MSGGAEPRVGGGTDPASDLAPRMVLIQPRTLWLAAAIGFGLAVLWVVVSQAISVFILVFIAIILAEGIRPLMEWLHQHHLPRPVAVLLIYLVALVALGLLAWWLTEPLIAELGDFTSNLPLYAAQAEQWLARAQQTMQAHPGAARLLSNLPAQVSGVVQQLGPFLVRGPITLISLLGQAALALLLAFFWLTATQGLEGFVVGLLPEDARDDAVSILAELSVRIGGYLRGILIDMVVIALLSGTGVWLLGVPYPILLGVFAGLMEAVPIVGQYVSGLVAVLVALTTGDFTRAVEVAILYLAIQQIEGNTLVPTVMTRVVGLNPFTLITTMLIGSALFGIVGALIGVPAAAGLKVLVLRVLAPAVRRLAGAA